MTNAGLSQSDATGDAVAIARLHEVFARQWKAFLLGGAPTVPERQAHLGALAGMLMAARTRIREAMVADFAVHPGPLTDMTEVLSVAGQAQYVAEQLPAWTQPSRRDVDRTLFGSTRAEMRYVPKGVLGIMSPWNLPFLLSLGPLVDMLGAGNRVIIKPSELAPASAGLMQELVAETFDPDHVTVVCGGLELARTFPALEWGHLLYTGNAAVGRSVALAAAQNLVPVTLELGGKSPAVVLSDAVNAETVAQIMGNKLAKSGQVCIAPDYCLVPAANLEEFVSLAQEYTTRTAPGYSASEDCTGIISRRHYNRLAGLRSQAESMGCRVVDLEAGAATDPSGRRCPPALVIDPPPNAAIMREEIFGPLLVVKTYRDLDDALAHITSGPPPLGLYVFTADPTLAETVLERTRSGGACVNTCAIQGVLPSMGIGGVGASGYGRHRGVEGFREFSHARAVVHRGTGDLIEAFFPPYVGGLGESVVDAAFGV